MMRYFLSFLLFFLWGTPQASPRANQSSAAAIVSRIQRADYEGDRAALKRLYEDLGRFTKDKVTGSRAHYWRGFALWRRSLNGFNESADRSDLERDLTLALAEFKKAIDGPDAADAQAAAAACLQNLAYLHYMQKDAGTAKEFLGQSWPLLKSAEAAEPNNPRVLWVLGASRWYAPPEQGGGEAAAFATYERGLVAARQHKLSVNEPLKPSWGEPELLMNLAWAAAHSSKPDLKQAEEYAKSALDEVPYWHYVRDILLPQIQAEMKVNKKAGNP